MCHPLVSATAAVVMLSAAQAASAGSLQVAPVSIDVVAPAASATVRLRNDGTAPLAAQVRVFRWSQVNGVEKLEPTDDVVASPPVVNLSANSEGVVRIVRTGPAAAQPEDTYRLLIDEIPDRSRQRPGNVTIVMRHSIPVFLHNAALAKPQVSFRLEKRDGRQFLIASNVGNRRIRLAKMALKDQSGPAHSFGQGLTGYVLAGSVMKWPVPAAASSIATATSLSVSADTDIGPLNEPVTK